MRTKKGGTVVKTIKPKKLSGKDLEIYETLGMISVMLKDVSARKYDENGVLWNCIETVKELRELMRGERSTLLVNAWRRNNGEFDVEYDPETLSEVA